MRKPKSLRTGALTQFGWWASGNAAQPTNPLRLEFAHFLIRLVWRAKKARQPPAVFGRIPTWKTNKTRRLPRRESRNMDDETLETSVAEAVLRDSRFGRETPKTTSRNALQPLSMRVRRIPSLKKMGKLQIGILVEKKKPIVVYFSSIGAYWVFGSPLANGRNGHETGVDGGNSGKCSYGDFFFGNGR